MTAIHAKPEYVEHIIRACVVLHNLLIKKDSKFYADKEFSDHFGPGGELVDGGWRKECQGFCFTDLAPIGGMNYTTEAKQVRDTLAKYFSNQGAVPWQLRMVTHTGPRTEESDSDDPDLA